MLPRTILIAAASCAFVALSPIAWAQTAGTTPSTSSSGAGKAPPVAGTEPGFTGLSGTTGSTPTSNGAGDAKQTTTGGNAGGSSNKN